jgi:hypothetical protein
MGKREDAVERLSPLLTGDGASFEELERVLVANSDLPGPRANLEMAWALGDAFAAIPLRDAHWDILCEWLSISEEEAAAGDPRVFLPFCALQALGSGYHNANDARRCQIIAALKEAAGDGRWRIREGASMGFQRIAEWSFPVVEEVFSEWVDGASLLERRAIVAALAHPPALKEPGRLPFCFHITDRILGDILPLDRASRRSEGFRVLKKGLMYAISVFVAHAPEMGFDFLKKWAATDDVDIERIVRSNLGKRRLTKRYPDQVNEVLAIL